MSTVSIAGLDRAAVLCALYDRATAGYHRESHQAAPTALPIDKARAMLEMGQTHFDHVYGRLLRVHLDDDTLDVSAYEEANGAGSAALAISKVRAAP